MRMFKGSLAVAAAFALALGPVASAQPTRDTELVFDKAEYDPGETIVVTVRKPYKCSELESAGFAGPISLKTVQKPEYALTGEGKVVDTPGSYEATVLCFNQRITASFTVKGPVTTPPPPTPTPKPKPPIVKPKGAPDTGGGGTAA